MTKLNIMPDKACNPFNFRGGNPERKKKENRGGGRGGGGGGGGIKEEKKQEKNPCTGKFPLFPSGLLLKLLKGFQQCPAKIVNILQFPGSGGGDATQRLKNTKKKQKSSIEIPFWILI